MKAALRSIGRYAFDPLGFSFCLLVVGALRAAGAPPIATVVLVVATRIGVALAGVWARLNFEAAPSLRTKPFSIRRSLCFTLGLAFISVANWLSARTGTVGQAVDAGWGGVRGATIHDAVDLVARFIMFGICASCSWGVAAELINRDVAAGQAEHA